MAEFAHVAQISQSNVTESFICVSYDLENVFLASPTGLVTVKTKKERKKEMMEKRTEEN